jgi:hypothetical protein
VFNLNDELAVKVLADQPKQKKLKNRRKPIDDDC